MFKFNVIMNYSFSDFRFVRRHVVFPTTFLISEFDWTDDAVWKSIKDKIPTSIVRICSKNANKVI